MGSNNTAIYAIMALGLAGGVAWWYQMHQDTTPVGVVVTSQTESARPLGENSDGKMLSVSSIEGTWRADEDALSVASESAEKPLMVIYEDGTPIHAELVTINEWIIDGPGMVMPDECCSQDPPNPPCDVVQVDGEECWDALTAKVEANMEKWRKLAKEHGVTDESIASFYPTEEESTTQEAESIFGPMLSLQSHFVW